MPSTRLNRLLSKLPANGASFVYSKRPDVDLNWRSTRWLSKNWDTDIESFRFCSSFCYQRGLAVTHPMISNYDLCSLSSLIHKLCVVASEKIDLVMYNGKLSHKNIAHKGPRQSSRFSLSFCVSVSSTLHYVFLYYFFRLPSELGQERRQKTGFVSFI